MSDSFRPALAAFARYRPSQPPEIRVTRLRLRSLHVTTWRFAHAPFRVCCRRAPPSCFRATAPPKLRGLSLLTSVGLSPTRRRVLTWTRQLPIFSILIDEQDGRSVLTGQGERHLAVKSQVPLSSVQQPQACLRWVAWCTSRCNTVDRARTSRIRSRNIPCRRFYFMTNVSSARPTS